MEVPAADNKQVIGSPDKAVIPLSKCPVGNRQYFRGYFPLDELNRWMVVWERVTEGTRTPNPRDHNPVL